MFLGGKSNVFAGRDKDSENVLHALLPGARINKESKKITINVGTSNETLVFNIGGTRFETYKSTLNRLPFSPLANEDFLKKHHRESKGDYFFDREPDVFKAILNYLRTGELHLPAWLCGASIKNELQFWGVQEDEIEECCWTSYSSWTTTLDALKRLERDMKGSLGHGPERSKGPKTAWSTFRAKGWRLLNDPKSSGWAKIFGAVSMMFVLLSIFSFCAETHESFHLLAEKKTIMPSFWDSLYENILNMTSITKASNVTGDAMLSNPLNNSTFNATSNVTQNDVEIAAEMEVNVHPSLFAIDILCLIYFVLEFMTRFILSPHKIRFFLLPMTVVDIIALLPDVVETGYRLSTSNFHSRETIAVIPVLRVTRIFRFFRLMRHIPGLWILFYTLKASLKELALMMLFLCVGMLVYASLIYFADDRNTFTSIPQGFWWALITMTTVGYGDMFPVTNLGYLVGSFTAVSGLLMIGFTVPILVNNFMMFYSHTQSSIERDRKKKERLKKLEAEARRRRPSMFGTAFNAMFAKNKEESIRMSTLASMAGDVSSKRKQSVNKGEITKVEPELSALYYEEPDGENWSDCKGATNERTHLGNNNNGNGHCENES